ncbi:MAG: RIP metalloprotease RseP [Cyanobacteria bacterium J06642_2]
MTRTSRAGAFVYMSILVSIGILALLIVVHELGHFAAARLQGIHANRFSIGFGPVLWSYQGAKTEYAIRALPLGGFVGFPDEDEDCPYPVDDPDLLKNRPILDRAIVMAAGVLANLVFAYLVLLLMVSTLGIPALATYESGIVVPEVATNSPAERAGLAAGDVILKAGNLDYTTVTSETDSDAAMETLESFQNLVRENEGQAISLTVRRAESTSESRLLQFAVTPRRAEPGDDPRIGVSLAPNRNVEYRPADNWREVLSSAGTAYQRVVELNLRGFARLIGNFSDTAGQISGPVGIVKMGADLAESDASSLFNFTALISINLAILNILPLPALDGGHLAFLAIEAVRGKRVPRIVEERVMQTGLVLILGLGVVLILKDTLTIVGGTG